MKNKIKFHLDENVSQAIANGLRRREIHSNYLLILEILSYVDKIINRIKF